jgi:hypothetical protein
VDLWICLHSWQPWCVPRNIPFLSSRVN